MHTDTKDVFIALFMAFLYGFTFHENTYDYHERDLRLYNSNSQIEKIVWRLTLPKPRRHSHVLCMNASRFSQVLGKCCGR